MVSLLDPRPVKMRSLDEIVGVAAASQHHWTARWTTPIGELSSEALRTLLARRHGVAHILPLALERLKRDPWIESCGYPGDLLLVVLGIEGVFTDPQWRERIEQVVAVADKRSGSLAPHDRACVEGRLGEAIARISRRAR